MKPTWHPHDDESSARDNQKNLPDSAFAFPKQRKEPMTDASHVRNAIARFDQVKDVSDADREQAFANLKAAAKHFHIDMPETSRHDLGSHPHTKNPKQERSSEQS
jgi:hypothetical protein